MKIFKLAQIIHVPDFIRGTNLFGETRLFLKAGTKGSIWVTFDIEDGRALAFFDSELIFIESPLIDILYEE